MNQLDLLTQAMLREPADDTVRLAIADWHEENGGMEGQVRAEFIRRQIDFGKMDDVCACDSKRGTICERCVLRNFFTDVMGEERFLKWFGDALKARWERPKVITTVRDYVEVGVSAMFEVDHSNWWVGVRRGFIDTVYLPVGDMASDHVKVMFRTQPVETVILRDVGMALGDDASCLMRLRDLPFSIRRFMRARKDGEFYRFEGEEDRQERVSEACIAFGRYVAWRA